MDPLIKLISGLSIAQRIWILALALAVGAGIITFSHWRHEGDFRPLYTSMAPEDSATVVQKLRETGVEYRLSDDGGSVMVPSRNLAESRLALAQAGLPKTGRIGFELFDKSNFGATEFVEHINYKRALEGELERSVMSLAEVETARVHLTLPKESIFLEQQQPAKASVMVKLKLGAQISSQNVQAVTNLVASAVEGLSPEAVSVVDMDGNLLNRPRKPAAEDGSELTSETLEVRSQIEKALVAKIGQTLEPLLGVNGFRAGASVDYDLTSGEQQEETLDPAKSVMLSSQKTEDLLERGATSGIPGTASNMPAAAAATRNPAGTSRRTENITYQTSRLIRHTRIPQGIVKRMSLAILVDQAVQWEGDGANRKRILVAPPPETLKTIKDLVAGVTGFNADRGDQLIVETLPFESSLHAEPPKINKPAPAVKTVTGPPWLQFVNKYRDFWTPVGIGVVLVMVLAFGLFRSKKRPVSRATVEEQAVIEVGATEAEVTGTGSRQLGPAEEVIQPPPKDSIAELAEHVRQMAKREPLVTANVLRMWLLDTKT
jgi:flagellar M-ring protein FliF